jgi:macrolide-specific efflux system membrane fusion protein
MRRLLSFVVLPLLVIAAGVFFFRDRLFAADAPSFIAAAVSRGDVEETVLATGIFKPAQLVAVGAQVSGRITALNVKLGDTVKKGALVAEIDSVTQRNDLRTAQASLANVRAQRDEAEADLENAQITLTRQQAIFDKQAGPKSDLDTAAATVKKTVAEIAALDAQITSAQVAVETAEANLAYTHITAPMDGTVLAIVNQQGQTVNAAQSAPTIVILGQLQTMTVRAEISEADVVKVKVGQAVNFTILGDPDNIHKTVLQSIEPAPESITSDSSVSSSSTSSSSSSTSSTSTSAIYYNGIFDVPNPDGRFRTYMSAEVHIVLGSARNVLTIPSAALGAQDADGQYAVQLVAADNSTSVRKVAIGLNNNVSAEIRSGLAEGDRVVIGEKSAATATTSRPGGGPPPMGL